MIRKWIAGSVAGLGLASFSAGVARAAQPAFEVLAQVKVSAPGGTTKYIAPGIVTVALFALALFVICKTSRRV